MKRNAGHSTLRRLFTSRLFLFVLFAIIIVIGISYARAYYQDYKVKEEIKTLEGEVRQLEKKKFQSMELLKYVTSDNFIEEKARTELNLKKPGENVIIISSTSTAKIPSIGTAPESRQDLSNPIKWWYYFIHKPLP